MVTYLSFLFMIALSTVSYINGQELPTVYEYFTENGVSSGLVADAPGFFRLNGKDLRIISGALHYFRVHPSQWSNRLKKLRAAGLNTVETYVAWNLHEPIRNEFDFGNGTSQFSPFLNLRNFIKLAQEEDLLVLVRPGPYICTEWEFGGLPSWLLQDPLMKVRTSYEPFLERAKIYLDKVISTLIDLEFTKGGPIIGFQIENEYGSFSPIDRKYIEALKEVYDTYSLSSLLFTSDGTNNGWAGALPNSSVLYTANFQSGAKVNLDKLLELQPNRPTMVMEFWAGWFDHWTEEHNVISPDNFETWLRDIFTHSNTSVNFYMFEGGTNFGFMAGANTLDKEPFYAPDVTSYDYDSPLTEAGDYTEKYRRAVNLISEFSEPKLKNPEAPAESKKIAYESLELLRFITYEKIIEILPSIESDSVIPMELFPINNGSGQSYGYIIYRATVFFEKNTTALKIEERVRDFAIILLDGKIINTDKYFFQSPVDINITVNEPGYHVLDILVENTGRINFGHEEAFLQSKGFQNGTKIMLDDLEINLFTIYSAEFKGNWIQEITNWENITTNSTLDGPCVIESDLILKNEEEIRDSFIDMSNWHKGIVFINGFNLGRYWKVGPQQTLYLPAPLLKIGLNKVTIFEQFEPGKNIAFRTSPILSVSAKN